VSCVYSSVYAANQHEGIVMTICVDFVKNRPRRNASRFHDFLLPAFHKNVGPGFLAWPAYEMPGPTAEFCAKPVTPGFFLTAFLTMPILQPTLDADTNLSEPVRDGRKSLRSAFPTRRGIAMLSSLKNAVVEFCRREDGPTAVEYAVMLALIIVVCLA